MEEHEVDELNLDESPEIPKIEKPQVKKKRKSKRRKSHSSVYSSRRRRIKKKNYQYLRRKSPTRALSNYKRCLCSTNFNRTTGRDTRNLFATRTEVNTVNLSYDPSYRLSRPRIKGGLKYSGRSATRFKDYTKSPALVYDLDRANNYFRPKTANFRFEKQTDRKSHFWTKIKTDLLTGTPVRKTTKKKGKKKGKRRRNSKRPHTSQGYQRRRSSQLSTKRPKTADPSLFRERPVGSTMVIDRKRARVRSDVLNVPVADFGRALSREQANRPGTGNNPPKSAIEKKMKISYDKKTRRYVKRFSNSRPNTSRVHRDYNALTRLLKKKRLVPSIKKMTTRKNHRSSWFLPREGSNIPFKVQRVQVLSDEKNVGKRGIPSFKKTTGRKGRYLTQFEVHDLNYKIKDRKRIPNVNLYLKPGRFESSKDTLADHGVVDQYSRMTDSLCNMLDGDIRELNRFERDLVKAERELRKKEKPLSILI